MKIEIQKHDLEEIVVILHNIARHISENHALGLVSHSVRVAADRLNEICQQGQREEA
jgi:hypothetical protein